MCFTPTRAAESRCGSETFCDVLWFSEEATPIWKWLSFPMMATRLGKSVG